MSDHQKASRSRRRLLELARKVLAEAEALAAERGPLLRGAFQLRGTRCGKPGCKCNLGELHTMAVLVVSDDGTRRSYYLRGPERPEVQRRVERYQEFRRRRVELNKLNDEIAAALDELLDGLLEPHSPLREAEQRKSATRKRRDK